MSPEAQATVGLRQYTDGGGIKAGRPYGSDEDIDSRQTEQGNDPSPWECRRWQYRELVERPAAKHGRAQGGRRQTHSSPIRAIP